MVSAHDALRQLQKGNARFAADASERSGAVTDAQRHDVEKEQHPYAVVLGCSDSRVPTSVIFDQGLGDVFTIRVAGNVAGPDEVASVDYAVEYLGTKLVVILGHEGCGAVSAALAAAEGEVKVESPHLAKILERISPAVREHCECPEPTRAATVDAAARDNVCLSKEQLLEQSAIVREGVASGEVEVVCAYYSLSTGKVEFLDEA